MELNSEDGGADVFKHKFVAVVFYVGFSYCGWQRQGEVDGSIPTTVQECIETAVNSSIKNSLYVSGKQQFSRMEPLLL
jgi:tRNA U38,U39,U40 pseudouridine synthase TruA